MPFPTYINVDDLFIVYDAISNAVYDRVVTAEDFIGTEGACQWALLDGYIVGEAISLIEIRRVLKDENRIEIFDHGFTPKGRVVSIDADELALRIEAS